MQSRVKTKRFRSGSQVGKRSRLKFRVQETDGEEFPESQDEVVSQG